MDHIPWRHAFDHTVDVPRTVLALCAIVLFSCMGWGQTSTAVEGHVLQASSSSKLPGVLVMAWPCGLAASTDALGAFRVSCPHGIDSLTLSCVGFDTQVVLNPSSHVDVWMEELKVMLGQAQVAVNRFSESEASALDQPTLMQALDRTPGLQSLDLGAGMIQPVVRGLFGSRVAVLEDGVPQQGGRWGSDHGVLVAPELQVASAWVPGGGHVWMGPEAVGGGLRFESPSRANAPNTQTRMGLLAQVGQLKGGLHALHIASSPKIHWHAGMSVAGFGAAQVPQRSFAYLDRVFELETGELTNTAGQSGHAVLGMETFTQSGGTWHLSMRASDVRQGLFPGIVGLPRQGDLEPNEGRFDIRLPHQHASRLQSMVRWVESQDSSASRWSFTASGAWNRRLELAPPHAHGWGPLPESDLSLSLEEWSSFAEVRRTGPHGVWGIQSEGQWVQTGGWEFLLADHQRVRWSVIGETTKGRSTVAGRLDMVHASQQGHQEPSYNAQGEVVGTDVRALPFRRTVPGGMVSWQRPMSWRNRSFSGHWSVVAYGRVPSNYEWGANGIHHGTFRFEQGNPDLTTEWAMEARAEAESPASRLGWRWEARSFAAVHRGFIAITPSPQFAPIAHAGQVYRFESRNAFRTGAEGHVAWHAERQSLRLEGAFLGQWDLTTGLGLPFTTPAQGRLEWRGRANNGWTLSLSGRGIAPAVLTARNEEATPGVLLADFTLSQSTNRGVWSLDIQNAFDRPWLDHTSAYRALGLVAQGRWVQLRFNTTLKH